MERRDGPRVSLASALAQIPSSHPKRFATVFEHGTLSVEIYAPIGRDDQTPHTRDEAYVVASGSGTFVRDEEREQYGPGDFLFAPAGSSHRFEDFTDDLAVWVLFYGPEGGEKKS